MLRNQLSSSSDLHADMEHFADKGTGCPLSDLRRGPGREARTQQGVIVIISTQVPGDVVNCVRGDWLRGGTGVALQTFFFIANTSSLADPSVGGTTARSSRGNTGKQQQTWRFFNS